MKQKAQFLDKQWINGKLIILNDKSLGWKINQRTRTFQILNILRPSNCVANRNMRDGYVQLEMLNDFDAQKLDILEMFLAKKPNKHSKISFLGHIQDTTNQDCTIFVNVMNKKPYKILKRSENTFQNYYFSDNTGHAYCIDCSLLYN